MQSDDYWSSTNYVGTTLYAWFVGLGLGGGTFAQDKGATNHVWPVRGGQ